MDPLHFLLLTEGMVGQRLHAASTQSLYTMQMNQLY